MVEQFYDQIANNVRMHLADKKPATLRVSAKQLHDGAHLLIGNDYDKVMVEA